MSIALMTLAWKSDLQSGPKMVLLALCDNANDQGECYPSVPMIAQKCSMSVRTVQGHIGDMEATGIIDREMRNGRSTVYRINAELFTTPAESAPRRICTPQNLHPTPAKSAPPPPQNLHPTPAESAPITIKEPSGEPSKNQRAPKSARVEPVALPDWLPLDAWNGYLAMRKAKRKEPTDRAVTLVLAALDRYRAAGYDVATILDTSTTNGWTDVYEPRTPSAPTVGPSGQGQPTPIRKPLKPRGLEPKGLDESYAEYDARIAAAEKAQRQGAHS